jgi:hypothetical protein
MRSEEVRVFHLREQSRHRLQKMCALAGPEGPAGALVAVMHLEHAGPEGPACSLEVRVPPATTKHGERDGRAGALLAAEKLSQHEGGGQVGQESTGQLWPLKGKTLKQDKRWMTKA